jgi:hypothetical protein
MVEQLSSTIWKNSALLKRLRKTNKGQERQIKDRQFCVDQRLFLGYDSARWDD